MNCALQMFFVKALLVLAAAVNPPAVEARAEHSWVGAQAPHAVSSEQVSPLFAATVTEDDLRVEEDSDFDDEPSFARAVAPERRRLLSARPASPAWPVLQRPFGRASYGLVFAQGPPSALR